jgi:hypothetical protein
MQASSRAIFTRRNMIVYVVIEVVLFVLANVTAKSASYPGPLSNMLWGLFCFGLLVLIVAEARTWRSSRRAA